MSSTGGFEQLTGYEEARTRLQERCSPHGRVTEKPLDCAGGRVAARPVEAARPVPREDRAAVDGIAVRASDTFAASARSPVRLTEASGAVADGQAVPVQTGSPMPEGADAVLRVAGLERRSGELVVFESVAVGANVAGAGSDVAAGDLLVGPGDRLGPADVALARATGCERVALAERPQVRVLPTGDGLVGTDPDAGERIETDGAMVASLARRWGGAATQEQTVPPEAAQVEAAIGESLDGDIVVTTGSTGVGERDLLPAVVADLGAVAVHGVALEPGRSVGVGTVSATPVVMLPGERAACYLAAVQFLRPAIAAIEEATARPVPTVRAELDGKLPSEPGTRTFARVRLQRGAQLEGRPGHGDGDPTATGAGRARAVPLRVGGANRLSSVTAADGWVEIPGRLEGLPAGETVTVQQWDWTGCP
jgi:molybdopterin molybdotransferase